MSCVPSRVEGGRIGNDCEYNGNGRFSEGMTDGGRSGYIDSVCYINTDQTCTFLIPYFLLFAYNQSP